MIPKVIHYCWFGRNSLPSLAVKCLESWKRFFPDYEIKEWNEDNFDVNIISYTAEAYRVKKYAFVSDYARFWILYHYGGLYFDTDVEVIKSMDDIIAKGSFMGCEKDADKEGATALAVAPGLGLYGELLQLYAGLHFIKEDGGLNLKTVVDYTTEVLISHGLKNVPMLQNVAGVWIYPRCYFNPKDYETGKMTITENTYSIHHFAASWHPWYAVLEKNIWNICGMRNHDILYRGVEKIKKGIRKICFRSIH